MVFRVKDPEILIAGGIAVTDGAGGVRGAVVHQDHLIGGFPLLGQDAVQARLQILYRVIYRDDHGKLHIALLFYSLTAGKLPAGGV